MKKLLIVFLLTLFSLNSFGQSRITTIPHEDDVIAIFPSNSNDSFFSVGTDGFIIEWENNKGKHFQITNNKIKKVAKNPFKNEFAIYETDLNNNNILSVWDWDTLEKKYSHSFSDSILSINYSKKSTYLILGTTTEQGTIFIDTSNGKIVNPIKEKIFMIGYAETATSEKNIFTYSVSGNIYYHNLQNGQLLKKIKTELGLDNILSFRKNKYIAGLKNDNILIINSITGKIEYTLTSSNPIIFTYQDELYYSTNQNKKISIFKFDSSTEKFETPSIYKNISFPKSENITNVLLTQEKIIFGTKSGNIYTSKILEETSLVAELISDTNIQKIIDFQYIEDDLFILTKSHLYVTNEIKSNVIQLLSHENFTKLLSNNSNLILWSQDNNSKVSIFDKESKKVIPLFTSKGEISSLKSFGSKLLCIENNSTIYTYNFENNKITQVYYGNGIQDAVLVNDQDLFVAKSVNSNNDSILLYVNIKTKETVPLKTKFKFIYSLTTQNSLSKEKTQEDNFIYGIAINEEKNKQETIIFKLDVATKEEFILNEFDKIDLNGFIKIHNDEIYTNILSPQFYSLKKSSKQYYHRNHSLPLKIEFNADNIVTLNQDKSLTWYEHNSPAVICDWYITSDHNVLEYE